jgi:hypothetical protein
VSSEIVREKRPEVFGKAGRDSEVEQEVGQAVLPSIS